MIYLYIGLVMVVAGERDTFTPASLSEHMGQAMPFAELLMVAGGTHVAPIEQPKYAVAVITRGPAERGRAAAAVAAQVYNALSNQIVRTDRNLAQTEFKLAPRNPALINNTAVADADEDEDEVEPGETNAVDMTGIDTNGRKVIIVPNAPQTKKFVTRTGSSKPVLPPVVITYDKENKETPSKPVIKP